MEPGYELFTRWRTLRQHGSDSAGALALGMSRQAISHWKTGENAPSLAMIKRMAKDLKIDHEGYALAIESKRASTPELGELLANVAKKFGPFAAGLILFVAQSTNTKCAEIHNNINNLVDITSAYYTFTHGTLCRNSEETTARL